MKVSLSEVRQQALCFLEMQKIKQHKRGAPGFKAQLSHEETGVAEKTMYAFKPKFAA